jgi:hypothetical protein
MKILKRCMVTVLEHGDDEYDPYLMIETDKGKYKVKLKNLKWEEDEYDELD